jgi:hypothetical protein
MKFLPLILILLCGCRALDNKVVQMSSMPKVEKASLIPTAAIYIATTNFNISWPPSPDTNVVGQRLLWGPTRSGYADQYSGQMELGKQTNATVTVPTGARYYFAVIATNNLGDLDSLPTDAVSDPITVPLTFALYFPNPGTALQSTRDMKRWSARAAVFNNGLWFATEIPGVRWEFYRPH